MALYDRSLFDDEPDVHLNVGESLDLAVPVHLVKEYMTMDCFWTPEIKKFGSVPLDINLADYCQSLTVSLGVNLCLELSQIERACALEFVSPLVQDKENWMMRKRYEFDETLWFGSAPNRNDYATVSRIAEQDWTNVVFDETEHDPSDLAVPVRQKNDVSSIIIFCYGMRKEQRFGSVWLNVVIYYRPFTMSSIVELNLTEEAWAWVITNLLRTFDTLIVVTLLMQNNEEGILQEPYRYGEKLWLESASNVNYYETVPRIEEQDWTNVVFDETARDTVDLAVPVRYKESVRTMDFFGITVKWQFGSVRLNFILATYYRSLMMLLNSTESSFARVMENRIHILDTLELASPLVQHKEEETLHGLYELCDKLWFESAPNRNDYVTVPRISNWNYVVFDETICDALDLAVSVRQKKDPRTMNYYGSRGKRRFRSVPQEINLAAYCPPFVGLSPTDLYLEMARINIVIEQLEKTVGYTVEYTKLLSETIDDACQTLTELLEETAFARRGETATKSLDNLGSQRSVQTPAGQRRRSLWKRSKMAVGRFAMNLGRHVCLCN